MNRFTFGTLRRLAALSLCLSVGLARAQEGPLEDDPPDRAARLSLVEGDVSLQPAGEEEWADAIVNRPLTTGDKVWTDRGARAEIQVGPASVRLDSDTGFSFLNVDDDTIQMRLTAGVVNVSVRALDGSDQIEIDTPNLALSILRAGTYRVEVNDAGDTTVVKVSEGVAEASGGSQSVIVHAQQSATFRGEEQFTTQFAALGAPDEFDSWSLERERRDDRAASSRTAQYVSPDVTGYEDLDDHGSWSSDTEYGYVWYPRNVAVDWSPYQFGRWVWVRPWGWTWIDDAPWGYAPFHYGRWAHTRNRWCWVPGPRHARAVYAPALVGWVGSPGIGVSVGVGGGRGHGVGWFPLGPREVYVPGRRFSPRYVERVNVSNTVIVNRSRFRDVYDHRDDEGKYRNRGVPGAVTTVSRSTFTSAQRVGGQRIRVDEREIGRGTGIAPNIEPVRESRLGANDSRRSVRLPPRAVADRRVVVKRDPPPAAARFVRDARQADPGREQRDRVDRTQDRPDGADVVSRDRRSGGIDGNTRPEANRRPAPAGSGVVRDERNVQTDREDRGAIRQRPDRPYRVEQNRDDGVVRSVQPSQPTQSPQPAQPDQRSWANRTQVEQRDRQERRQNEVQVRERVERQVEHEQRAARPQREAEPPRVVTPQPQARERSVERPVERPNTERREVSPPAESRPQAQPQAQPQTQPQAQPQPQREAPREQRPRDKYDRR